ncbi:MAG: ABC transporter substrate-binding protein [Thermodesulfobacteriota bacterium]
MQDLRTIFFVALGVIFQLSAVFAAEPDAPIRIGLAHVFSGGMAKFGNVARQGAQLAVTEINQGGGVLGRPLELVDADTAVNPDVAEKAVQKLVMQDQVSVVMGIVSSAVAKRVAPLVNSLKCPLIVTHAMAQEITTTIRNPWVFRITWNLDQCYKASALVAKEMGATRWTTVGPDYGFGQDSWQYFKRYLSEFGDYSFDAGVFLPVSTTDWKPVVEKLRDSRADGIMVSLWGDNLRGFLKAAQAIEAFKDKKVLCPVGGSVEEFVALRFLYMPQGVWFGSPYWYEAYDNASNKTFIERYQALGDARIPPSYAAYNTYAAVRMFKAAVEKAGGPGREAVARALEGLTVADLPAGPTTFRKEDHQAIFTVSFGKTSGRAAANTSRIQGLVSIRRFDGALITPRVE